MAQRCDKHIAMRHSSPHSNEFRRRYQIKQRHNLPKPWFKLSPTCLQQCPQRDHCRRKQKTGGLDVIKLQGCSQLLKLL